MWLICWWSTTLYTHATLFKDGHRKLCVFYCLSKLEWCRVFPFNPRIVFYTATQTQYRHRNRRPQFVWSPKPFPNIRSIAPHSSKPVGRNFRVAKRSFAERVFAEVRAHKRRRNTLSLSLWAGGWAPAAVAFAYVCLCLCACLCFCRVCLEKARALCDYEL